jgi:hypothetical protein
MTRSYTPTVLVSYAKITLATNSTEIAPGTETVTSLETVRRQRLRINNL